MKKLILLSFTLLISMGLWAQTIESKLEEVTVKPPKFTGVMVVENQGQQSIEKYIAENVQYPAEDKKYNVEGTEVVQFVVNTDGTLSDFEVVNSVSPEMDDEFIQVLKETSGKWTPGSNNEGPVDMHKQVTVVCKVTDGKFPNIQTDFNAEATDYFKKGAKLLYVKNKPKKALSKFNEGIRYLPFEPNLLVMRGYAKLDLGDKEGAIKDWTVVKDQTGLDYLKLLANIYAYIYGDLDAYNELAYYFIE